LPYFPVFYIGSGIKWQCSISGVSIQCCCAHSKWVILMSGSLVLSSDCIAAIESCINFCGTEETKDQSQFNLSQKWCICQKCIKSSGLYGHHLALFLKFIFNLFFFRLWISKYGNLRFDVFLCIFWLLLCCLLWIMLCSMLLSVASSAIHILDLSFFDNFTAENWYRHSRRSWECRWRGLHSISTHNKDWTRGGCLCWCILW